MAGKVAHAFSGAERLGHASSLTETKAFFTSTDISATQNPLEFVAKYSNPITTKLTAMSESGSNNDMTSELRATDPLTAIGFVNISRGISLYKAKPDGCDNLESTSDPDLIILCAWVCFMTKCQELAS